MDGESHLISGLEDLDHTHTARVLRRGVGGERRFPGRLPLDGAARRGRPVLDPSGRLDSEQAIFQQVDGSVLHVVSDELDVRSDVERLLIPAEGGQFDLPTLLAELHTRGVRRLFIEGGGVTLTRFLTAGLLDRLHLAVAPVLLGQGRPGFAAPFGGTLSESPRPGVTVTPLGDDWLFDCDFGAMDEGPRLWVTGPA